MFTMSIPGLIVWWVGGQSVLAGMMTLGELMAFLGFVVMLNQPLMMIQRIIDWTSRSLTEMACGPSGTSPDHRR